MEIQADKTEEIVFAARAFTRGSGRGGSAPGGRPFIGKPCPTPRRTSSVHEKTFLKSLPFDIFRALSVNFREVLLRHNRARLTAAGLVEFLPLPVNDIHHPNKIAF
jgi:hypothetical protein